MFILSPERDAPYPAVFEGFQRYAKYLAENEARFPPNAYALATSTWYYDPSDHRSPHDAWLESVTIGELSSGPRQERRAVTLRARLLGAYHDGYIELTYSHVFRYRLSLQDGAQGHRDWRYDEFRVSEEGHLVHEIQWASAGGTGEWVIEAVDVDFQWCPTQASSSPAV